MSAQEFAEWQIVFRKEQLHPGVMRMRHAQVLATTLTGAASRKDRKPWTAADFMEHDVWAPAPEQVAAPKPASLGGEAGRMKSLFTRKGRR